MLDGTTETLDNNGTAKAMYNLPSHLFSFLRNVLYIVLLFVFWPLCCLCFDVRLLIIHLASSQSILDCPLKSATFIFKSEDIEIVLGSGVAE
jgi:hypothetical protein